MTNALQACAVNDVVQDVLLMSVRSPARECGMCLVTQHSPCDSERRIDIHPSAR
jgi:hypothetical protein